MKNRGWLVVCFLLLILPMGCADDSVDTSSTNLERMTSMQVIESPQTYPVIPDYIPEPAGREPVCQDFDVNMGTYGCDTAIQFLYCRLRAPIVYNSVTYDQTTALQLCKSSFDNFWWKFRRCTNDENIYGLISCLESKGVATEFPDEFDTNAITPDLDVDTRSAHSALNYRYFYGYLGGANSISYQVFLGIRDGQTGQANIYHVLTANQGIYETHSIAAFGSNAPSVYPVTSFWLAGLYIHIWDLFRMTMSPYLDVFEFVPLVP